MSKTTRHRDFWKMRRLSAEMRRFYRRGMTLAEMSSTEQAPEYQRLRRDFERIWARYGFKSMVNDKRRRVSTRRANSEYVRELRRAGRRAADQRLRMELELADLDTALWPVRPPKPWSRAGRGP